MKNFLFLSTFALLVACSTDSESTDVVGGNNQDSEKNNAVLDADSVQVPLDTLDETIPLEILLKVSSSSAAVIQSSESSCGNCEPGYVKPLKLNENVEAFFDLVEDSAYAPAKRSLDDYVKLYTDAEIFFDKHVVAYSLLNFEFDGKANPMTNYFSDRNVVKEIPDSLMGYLFPRAAKVLKGRGEKCTHYVFTYQEASLPKGVVVTNIGQDTVDLLRIGCMRIDSVQYRTYNNTEVFSYLLEYCGDDKLPLDKKYIQRYKGHTSPKWVCSNGLAKTSALRKIESLGIVGEEFLRQDLITK